MGSISTLDHPLIQHKLSILRDKRTGAKEFRELVSELAMLMAYEVTRDLPLKEVEVQTPVGKASTKVITGRKIALVPILRAGLGMVDGVLRLIPAAKIGHVGIFRDPSSLTAVEYYIKLPFDSEERELLVLEPMIATGNTTVQALTSIKSKGALGIKLVSLIASSEGIARIQREHPEVDIYVAAIDPTLNEHGYIVPGLGDAGDRMFGTR